LFSLGEDPLLQVEHPPSLSPHAVQCDLRFKSDFATEVSAAFPISSVWEMSMRDKGTIDPTGNCS
jgi:hypothetical protein